MYYKNLRETFEECDDLCSFKSLPLTGSKFEVLGKTSGGTFRVRLPSDGLEFLAWPEEIFYLGLVF